MITHFINGHLDVPEFHIRKTIAPVLVYSNFSQYGLFLNLQLTDRHHSKVTAEILKTFDSSNEVVLVLLHLPATFDTLDHTLLIERLRLYLNFSRHCSAMVHIIILMGPFSESNYSGAPNENIVQNHLNIALFNVF